MRLDPVKHIRAGPNFFLLVDRILQVTHTRFEILVLLAPFYAPGFAAVGASQVNFGQDDAPFVVDLPEKLQGLLAVLDGGDRPV